MASRACLVAVALQCGLWHSAVADPTISFDVACIQDQMQASVRSPEQEAINCETTNQDPALGKALTKTLVGREIVSEAMRVLSEPEGAAHMKTIMAFRDYQERAKQIAMVNLEDAKRDPKLVSQMVLELRSPENQAKLMEVFVDPNFEQYTKSLSDPSRRLNVDKVFSKFAAAPTAPKVRSAVSASPSAVRPPSAASASPSAVRPAVVQRGSDIMMNAGPRLDADGNPITEMEMFDPILVAIQALPWLALLVVNPF